MTGSPQTEPKEIREVLLSVEARQFWERVYCACVERGYAERADTDIPALADAAVRGWQKRFAPKAGE